MQARDAGGQMARAVGGRWAGPRLLGDRPVGPRAGEVLRESRVSPVRLRGSQRRCASCMSTSKVRYSRSL